MPVKTTTLIPNPESLRRTPTKQEEAEVTRRKFTSTHTSITQICGVLTSSKTGTKLCHSTNFTAVSHFKSIPGTLFPSHAYIVFLVPHILHPSPPVQLQGVLRRHNFQTSQDLNYHIKGSQHKVHLWFHPSRRDVRWNYLTTFYTSLQSKVNPLPLSNIQQYKPPRVDSPHPRDHGPYTR